MTRDEYLAAIQDAHSEWVMEKFLSSEIPVDTDRDEPDADYYTADLELPQDDFIAMVKERTNPVSVAAAELDKYLSKNGDTSST